MSKFNSARTLFILNAPNLELQLDYVEPLTDEKGKEIYVLAEIDTQNLRWSC